MLRVADKSFDSNVGRQRTGNEDNFFVRPPLFVVADGMGGAQAGEVASQMAVEAFRSGLADEYEPEASLREIIEQANERIHEMSRSDSQRQGMGTTCTAAYVGEDDVVLAHVGDSRCYLFRDGELSRLTTDHSLVGELVSRGKITEDEAELHPQRSVITRALGPEGQVRVDTQRIAARNGDLFLLCSDGLTSMIREHQILPILQQGGTLEELVRNLIGAANDAGGRDNITVILFRIEEVEAAAGSAAARETGDGYDDFGSGTTRDDDQPTLAGDDAITGEQVADAVTEAERQAAADAEAKRLGTVALAAIKPNDPRAPLPGEPGHADGPPPAGPTTPTEPIPAAATAPPPSDPEPVTRVEPAAAPSAPPPPVTQRTQAPPGVTRSDKPSKGDRPKRKRGFPLKGLLILLVILAIILGGAWIATRAVFFIGADDNSRAVTIYRGMPYDLPLGLELYSRHYSSGKTLDEVPASRRKTFTDHKLRSLSDAEDLVKALEEGRLQP